MTETQGNPTILYYSEKYPEQNIIYKIDRKTIIDGDLLKTPIEYIRFSHGRYTTNDPKKQAFIEGLEDYAQKIIIRCGDIAKLKGLPDATPDLHPVKTGGLSTRNKAPAIVPKAPPVEQPPAPVAAAVPAAAPDPAPPAAAEPAEPAPAAAAVPAADPPAEAPPATPPAAPAEEKDKPLF